MNRYFIILVIGFLCGIGIIILQNLLNIPQDIFMHYYWIIGAGVVVCAVIFNIIYVSVYQKKMKEAVLLLEAGKTEEYIKELERLGKKAKGRHLKATLSVNLSAGYSDLKKYDKAIEILEALPEKVMTKLIRVAHHINLCSCYFYTDKTDKAVALYESSIPVFEEYKNVQGLGGGIAVLEIYTKIAKKEYSAAQEKLEEARKIWTEKRLQYDYKRIEEYLREHEA